MHNSPQYLLTYPSLPPSLLCFFPFTPSYLPSLPFAQAKYMRGFTFYSVTTLQGRSR